MKKILLISLSTFLISFLISAVSLCSVSIILGPLLGEPIDISVESDIAVLLNVFLLFFAIFVLSGIFIAIYIVEDSEMYLEDIKVIKNFFKNRFVFVSTIIMFICVIYFICLGVTDYINNLYIDDAFAIMDIIFKIIFILYYIVMIPYFVIVFLRKRKS